MNALISRSLCVALFGATAAAHATEYAWDASSGLLPSETATPFTLIDTASPEDPVLANGLLTLSGNLVAEKMYYIVSGNDLGLPEVLDVDFRMRYVSGNRTTPSVAPAAVALTTTTDGAGIALWIGADEAFLSSSNDGRSDSITGIDTNDAFHDYRIVIDGRAAGSNVQVWQDGAPILDSVTFNSASLNGTVPRVAFGEISIRAAGVSEWTSFRAGSVSPVPEPAAAGLLLAGLPLLAWRWSVMQRAA